jgi:histidine triad (HIT) family protein
MSECVFCKIIAGAAPAEKLFQDDQVTAFRDKHPIASTHVLIVPNKHIHSVNELSAADETLLGHMFTVARQLAYESGIAGDGYRLIVNTGAGAGQAVFHLHLHLIGGRRMRSPMG